MAARPDAAGNRAARGSARVDIFHGLWKLLTNVKLAVLLVSVIAFACFLGVVIPQMPGEMRDNPAGRSAWLEAQRQDFGIFTDLMVRADLFEVFYSWWFNGLWVVLMVAMTVATVSRIRPVNRTVRRPPKRVNDRYFETARYRATAEVQTDTAAVEDALRRRRYRVEEVARDGETTYLFADRFSWAYYGTFLTHLALLLFLVGGLLTRFVGFDRTVAIAETGAPAPVFAETRADQIFIGMQDAIQGVDAEGNIVDFRSHIRVTQGDEAVTCTTTVNDPCNAFGYSIHQAAFFDDMARLRITGPDGGVLYDDLLDFGNSAVSVPHLRITGPEGAVLFDQVVPEMARESSPEGERVSYADVVFPAGDGADEVVPYAAAWTVIDGEMRLSVGGDSLSSGELRPGDTVTSDNGYTVEFVEGTAIPAVTLTDLPGTRAQDGLAVVQMPADRQGRDYLYVGGVDERNVALEEGEQRTTGAGYTYEFGGRVEGSGLSVKQDPGDTFIWLAVGLATIGLGITFYVPRRRLWAKIAPGEARFAGMAERTTRFDRELRKLCAELGDERHARAERARADD